MSRVNDMSHGEPSRPPRQPDVTGPPRPSRRARRSDAGRVRITPRDAAGLAFAAQMYACPYDLLARRLKVTTGTLHGILFRWRRAGLAETAVITPGPAWCWITQHGLDRLGYPWTASEPALSLLAHIRAAVAVRLWLESGEEYRERRAKWRPEREIRAGLSAAGRMGHVPDAEIIWPGNGTTRGERWAVEVELTPKGHDRVTRIISGLLKSPYACTVYLCSKAALPVVTRAAATFPDESAARIIIRPVPPAALMPPSAPDEGAALCGGTTPLPRKTATGAGTATATPAATTTPAVT